MKNDNLDLKIKVLKFHGIQPNLEPERFGTGRFK